MKRLFAKYTSVFLVVAVLLSISAGFACAAGPSDEPVYITISSEHDLRAFAQQCRLDTWSQNTVVTLACDITLTGKFEPIPVFSGTFNGQNHTISGLNVKDSYSRAGFFGILTETAQVRNLFVKGTVSPSGDTVYAGGIAGENRGYIEVCAFSGKVSSKTVSGGIAGYNSGVINGCVNFSEVDVNISKSTRISIKSIKSSGIKGVVELVTNGTLDSASDRSGGIVGDNSGALLSCKNYGLVGTLDKSQNVGGIAGSNSGYIALCCNYSSIEGSRNVGGLVGLSLPYVKSTYSEDLLAGSKKELDSILLLVDNLTYDIDNAANDVSGSISGILDTISVASTHAGAVTTQASNMVNVKIGEVNQVKDYANTAVSGIEGVTSGIDEIGTAFNNGLKDFSMGISILTSESEDPDKIEKALELFGDGLVCIGDAVTGLDDTTTELHTMFSDLSSRGLPNFSGMSSELTGSLTALTTDLQLLSIKINDLNRSLNNTVNSLMSNVRAITGEARSLADGIYSTAYSISENGISIFLSNTSGVELSGNGYLYGVVRNSLNTGNVKGDSCVGGITGSMTVSSVPDIDTEGEPEGVSLKSFQYRSIIHACKSYGSITSTNGKAGGIVGNETIGAVTECENYGQVSSDKGGYVGGIAGSAHGLVRNCFVRCSLEGNSFVGGITGCGSAKQFIVDESSVVGCYADVSISRAEQHKGGISGSDEGYFLYNYFVGSTLNGIDEYSRELEAAPITMSTLLAVENCPEEFSWSEQQLSSVSASNRSAIVIPVGSVISALIVLVPVLLIVLLVLLLLKRRSKKKETEVSGSSGNDGSSVSNAQDGNKRRKKTSARTGKASSHKPSWKD